MMGVWVCFFAISNLKKLNLSIDLNIVFKQNFDHNYIVHNIC